MGTVLDVQNVVKHFPVVTGGVIRRRFRMLRAVDGVTFSINKGDCFGLAGESGSGKTTISRLILLLEKITSGSILYENRDISRFTDKDIKWYRTCVQTIFQDAASSLNPRMRIRDIVGESLEVQLGKTLTKREISARTEEMIRLVGLPADKLANYPHELSGGQKQRVAIAKAIILHPDLVILDEPVSSLDVSIRAQILNLLADIQEKQGLTYLIIAHDLAMLQHITTDIGVMYLGSIVETGKTDKVFDDPLHPYTKALFAAVPWPVPGRIKRAPALRGEIGNPLDRSSGCRFHHRCEYVEDICRTLEPPLIELRPAHRVACHRAKDL